MAYTTINKPNLHFKTNTYNGTSGSINFNLGFQPDFIWTKNRIGGYNNVLVDALRGNTKVIISNSSNAEGTCTEGITSFNSDGYTVGANTSSGGFEDDFNGTYNSSNYVSWNWKANGQGSSNTAGTINTTYTSANTAAGFSIITYTGNGSANATIGHGLGVEPETIFFKNLASNNWIVYHKEVGTGYYLTLNSNSSKDSASGAWCTPSSTLITLNQVFGATNTNGANYVAYCWASKTGFSKFGYYTGQENADGPFIYTGFKPAFVVFKKTSGSTQHWVNNDSVRSPTNVMDDRQYWSQATADATNSAYEMDYYSNGFKVRSNSISWNADGVEYAYWAWAENPLVGSNGVPATAR